MPLAGETCLHIQAQMHDGNVDIRLGELMLRKGYLTPAQVTDVLRLQQKTIMECKSCGKAFNVPAYRLREGFKCPKCDGELRLRAHPENINVAGEIEPPKPCHKPVTRTVGLPEPQSDRLRYDAAEPSRDREGAVPAGHAATGPDTPTIKGSAGLPSPPTEPRTRFKGTPFGRYLLLEELGRGGMGIVYKAWDTQLKRTVALKMMLEKEADLGLAMIRRFERETQSVAKLRHPHIVQIYDVGVHEGSHYFTMDFLEGETLKDMLADFHAARGGGFTAHGSGQVMGTPGYMSPEQAQGKVAKVGPQSDVYALGVILYEIVTGRLPFVSDNIEA